MSVVEFKRNTAKEQVLEILEEFDFEKGAVLLYMDSDVEDLEGRWSIVTTYNNFGIKEVYATDTVAAYVRGSVYSVEEE